MRPRLGRCRRDVQTIRDFGHRQALDVVQDDHGSRVMRFLCRISLEPDSCVRQSQEKFARYGARALLVAKFVPGLNGVAQPLAGVLGMQRRRLLVFDVLGALLWIGGYMVLGHVFSDQLERVAAYGAQVGTWAIGLLLGALVLYVGVKYVRSSASFVNCESRASAPVSSDRSLTPANRS